MLGSDDCMHWQRKTVTRVCVVGIKVTAIILKVVASKDLWIWYTFFWHVRFPQQYERVSAHCVENLFKNFIV